MRQLDTADALIREVSVTFSKIARSKQKVPMGKFAQPAPKRLNDTNKGRQCECISIRSLIRLSIKRQHLMIKRDRVSLTSPSRVELGTELVVATDRRQDSAARTTEGTYMYVPSKIKFKETRTQTRFVLNYLQCDVCNSNWQSNNMLPLD